MIWAHCGCVDIADAALKDLDSVCALAANNRRTNAWTETGGIYTDLLSKCGAKRRAYLLAKLLTRQQIHREHCVGAASVKGCGHHDFLKKFLAMFKILSSKLSA